MVAYRPAPGQPSSTLTDRVSGLIEGRTPFVQATVVRAQCPTSARPGDAAIVLADGSLEGFIGGHCAEGSVRAAGLDVLESRQPVLLRILPDDSEEFPESPGALTVVNSCLSGGALEIYLEPRIPANQVLVVGETPIANALVRLGLPLGLDMQHSSALPTDAISSSAVIVATHGRAEPETVRLALDAGVGFVGVVASSKRGASLRNDLGLSPEEDKALHSPVGLWIGAKTAAEIALSILGDIIKAIRLDGLEPPKFDITARPETAIDPVCGMTVTIEETTPHLHHDEVDYWFCNPGCRSRHEAEIASCCG